MDEKAAKSILKKLLDATQAGSVPAMSNETIEALRTITENSSEEASGVETSGTEVRPSATLPPTEGAPEQLVIESRSLKLEHPEDPDILMCLDFGTAMSKAFAIKTEGSGKLTLIDLALGKAGGEPPGVVYPLSSSIWISDDGLIFFGHDAVRKSLMHGRRPRLDSIKQYLSQGDVTSLTHFVIGQPWNPSGVGLNVEDILTLYLSYLTDIACSALAARGISRYVRRRFALPPWEPGRRGECETLLSSLLASAQVVADFLHGQWGNGIRAATAKRVLDEVRALGRLPLCLLDRGVSEPLAAAQGRLGFDEADELMRGLAVVIDVGAGTTDLGLFHVNKVPGDDTRLVAVPISQRNLKQAGDFIDECLRKLILRTTGVSNAASGFKLINDRLALDIRGFKERLFINGSLTDALSDGTPINITLAQLLAEPDLLGFADRLGQAFEELLSSKETENWIRTRATAGLLLVFTGGGSDLPMVQGLANHRCSPHAIAIENRTAQRTPTFVEDTYPLLVPEYPQLAVAIGGAHPNLADEAYGAGEPYLQSGVIARPSWTG